MGSEGKGPSDVDRICALRSQPLSCAYRNRRHRAAACGDARPCCGTNDQAIHSRDRGRQFPGPSARAGEPACRTGGTHRGRPGAASAGGGRIDGRTPLCAPHDRSTADVAAGLFVPGTGFGGAVTADRQGGGVMRKPPLRHVRILPVSGALQRQAAPATPARSAQRSSFLQLRQRLRSAQLALPCMVLPPQCDEDRPEPDAEDRFTEAHDGAPATTDPALPVDGTKYQEPLQGTDNGAVGRHIATSGYARSAPRWRSTTSRCGWPSSATPRQCAAQGAGKPGWISIKGSSHRRRCFAAFAGPAIASLQYQFAGRARVTLVRKAASGGCTELHAE